MVVLGIVSTGAFAAPAKAIKGSTDQAFWQGIVDRNQDSAYMVTGLRPGQMKVTGEVKTGLTYKKGGLENGAVLPNPNTSYDRNKSITKLNLNSAELYFDYKVNNFAKVHVAVGRGYSNVPNSSGLVATPASEQFFFPEAYVNLSHDNFFAKIGRQYLNFGSTSHHSISTPLTQDLSESVQTAVTLGAYNFNGFYVDAALYNGAAQGRNNNNFVKSANNVHGYTLEAGYAMNTADYNFNLYVDYLSNMVDVTSVNVYAGNKVPQTSSHVATGSIKATPAVALHGDFTTGPFTVKADYVMATDKIQTVTKAGLTKDYGKPQAYSLEGDYRFMPAQTVTLGFEGTEQAARIYPLGSGTSNTNAAGVTSVDGFQLPKTRLLAAYSYDLSKHVTLQGEFTHDKDYGVDNTNAYKSGSGKSNNTATDRKSVV